MNDKQSPAALMRAIAPVIAEHVQMAMEPLSDRIRELAKRVRELEERQQR